MIVINSASYVNPEFVNEIGLIPPCFLPLGNKKLLTYQVNNLRKDFKDERIILSLPDSYVLSYDEKLLIEKLMVEVVFLPSGLSLGTALLFLLNTITYSDSTLRLLHGDTLLYGFPKGINLIGLTSSSDNYEWEQEPFDNDTHLESIWCGYFAISSIKIFIRSLALIHGCFIKAMRLYIDETKPNFVNVDSWYDFGHINTYFKSRASITTQRAFNSLSIQDGKVIKSGQPFIKIEAELNWYLNIPPSLKLYTPQILDHGKDFSRPYYELEYLPFLPLNELFVNGQNPSLFWKKIINKIKFLMEAFRNSSDLTNESSEEKIIYDSQMLYREKTFDRFNKYPRTSFFNTEVSQLYEGVELPSIRGIAQKCIDLTLNQPCHSAVLHGDFCFSNLLYDSRSDIIKVIDPRGLNYHNEFIINGDQKYDLAKLCHSFIGLYDFIIADLYKINYYEDSGLSLVIYDNDRIKEIQKLFLNENFIYGFNTIDIIPATILLFLNMVPLHEDNPNRQKAMLLNALRLYRDYLT